MALDKDKAEKFINQFWPTAFYTETRPVDFGTLYGFFVQDGDRYAFDQAYLVQNKSKAGYLQDIKRMGRVDDHNNQHDELLCKS